MKKRIKIIFANIACLLILFLLADFTMTTIYSCKAFFRYSYKAFYQYQNEEDFKLTKLQIISLILNMAKKSYIPVPELMEIPNDRFETDLPYDNNKNSLLLMGCSFIYGEDIEANENLAYYLQKYTKRKTYNFGYFAKGIQHVLYILQSDNFKNLNYAPAPPKYMINVFISDHMRRMYCNYYDLNWGTKYLRYKKVNDNLELDNSTVEITPMSYFKAFYTAKRFNNLMYRLKSDNEKFNMYKMYVLAIKEELNKMYPDTKLAIIIYNPNADLHNFPPFKTDRWKELEDEGIKIIRFDTPEFNYLTEDEYLASDKVHPSGKAWETLAPIIIEQLDL